MNSKSRIIVAGAACLLGCAIAFADTPSMAAPAAENPVSGPAPGQGYVLMSGHWNSEGGQWKWIAAHWELPPSRSATWISGHWVSSSGTWAWMNGAWNITDAAQAQSGPPLPPGQSQQGGAMAQSLPMPSTPAPYVEGQFQGQYGPDGSSRALDQPPVTADYGPMNDSADNSAAYAYPAYYGYSGYYGYPGYGWAGNPWFWGGYPGGFLSFGFGPRFYGGGRGSFRGPGHGGFGHGGFGHGHGGGGGGFAHGHH